MTKIHWIVLGLIVVLVGGYFFMKSDEAPRSDLSESEEAGERKMSFGDFVRQGGSYQCDIEQSMEGTVTKGKAYINDGMIKGEYVTEGEGLSITSYVLVRDGYAHTWTSFAPNMGFKAPVTGDAEPDGSTETSGSYSFDADSVGNYDCQPWTADASVFALPAGVTFSEVNR